MCKNEILAKLQVVFRDCFDNDSIILKNETSAADIDGWDSLMHMAIIGAVEDEFNVKFKMKDILAMQNIGDFVNLLDENLNKWIMMINNSMIK